MYTACVPKVWLLINEAKVLSVNCIVINIIRQKITTLYIQVASYVVVYLVVLYRNLFLRGKH